MEFQELTPDHDCTGDPDTCPYPQALGFSAVTAPDGVGVDTSMQVHLLSPDQVATTLMKMYDGMMIEGPGDAPVIIKFARAREEFRQAIEQTEPPEAVQEALRAMMEERTDD